MGIGSSKISRVIRCFQNYGGGHQLGTGREVTRIALWDTSHFAERSVGHKMPDPLPTEQEP